MGEAELFISRVKNHLSYHPSARPQARLDPVRAFQFLKAETACGALGLLTNYKGAFRAQPLESRLPAAQAEMITLASL